MKIPSLDGEASSMNEIAFPGCHPWIEKCHPRMEMIDMDGAQIKCKPEQFRALTTMDKVVPKSKSVGQFIEKVMVK